MTKKVILSFRLLMILGMEAVVLSACAQSSTSDPGVVINGVKWATRNVAAPGTFVAKPEDLGMFYQWNRKKAWPTTGENVTDWDDDESTSGIWEKANNPCPAGWHVPTLDEIKTLSDTDRVSHIWTIKNGIYGRKFTDNATGNSMFLPAAGYRNDYGTLNYVGTKGVYWSSTESRFISATAYILDFDAFAAYAEDFFTGEWMRYNKAYGLSVRAVAD